MHQYILKFVIVPRFQADDFLSHLSISMSTMHNIMNPRCQLIINVECIFFFKQIFISQPLLEVYDQQRRKENVLAICILTRHKFNGSLYPAVVWCVLLCEFSFQGSDKGCVLVGSFVADGISKSTFLSNFSNRLHGDFKVRSYS